MFEENVEFHLETDDSDDGLDYDEQDDQRLVLFFNVKVEVAVSNLVL